MIPLRAACCKPNIIPCLCIRCSSVYGFLIRHSTCLCIFLGPTGFLLCLCTCLLKLGTQPRTLLLMLYSVHGCVLHMFLELHLHGCECRLCILVGRL